MCPRGISVDNDGNVYVVGNRSNNVVVISPDGQRHRKLLSFKDGLSYPFVKSLSPDVATYRTPSILLLVMSLIDLSVRFNIFSPLFGVQ
jgi:DNA-binding beta-propeller fold protein YncE